MSPYAKVDRRRFLEGVVRKAVQLGKHRVVLRNGSISQSDLLQHLQSSGCRWAVLKSGEVLVFG
jgi:hypothetical protein